MIAQLKVMASLLREVMYITQGTSVQFSDSSGEMSGSVGEFKASLMSRISLQVWLAISLSLKTEN